MSKTGKIATLNKLSQFKIILNTIPNIICSSYTQCLTFVNRSENFDKFQKNNNNKKSINLNDKNKIKLMHPKSNRPPNKPQKIHLTLNKQSLTITIIITTIKSE